VVDAARHNGDLARTLATSVPDQLARVAPDRREAYLDILGGVVRTQPAAAGLVARSLPELIAKLGHDALARFLEQGIALHDHGEKKAESFLRRESQEGKEELARLIPGERLEDHRRTLTHYARAHCGEDVQVRSAGEAKPGRAGSFSDGRHVYLPPRSDRFGDERDFLAYRVATARAVGHLEFGTYDLELARVPGTWPDRRVDELEIERFLRAFANRTLARDLFNVAEDARIERKVRQEYPGVARDIERIAPQERADRPAATDKAPVEQVLEALFHLSRYGAPPDALDEGPTEIARACWAELEPLLDGDVHGIAEALVRVYAPVADLMRKAEEGPTPQPDGSKRRRGPSMPGGDGQPQDGDGQTEETPYRGMQEPLPVADIRPEELTPQDRAEEAEALELLEQLRQEGSELDLARLRRALRSKDPGDERSYEEMVAFLERMEAPGGGLVEESEDAESRPFGTLSGTIAERLKEDGPAEQSFLYREWDATISDYKPDWVRLQEHVLRPGSGAFVERVRDDYGPTIHRLRRRFEALRPDAMRRVRRLADGTDLDLDSVVDARVTRRAGGSPSDRLYEKQLRDRRDVAVAFLLDMSSSTNEMAGPDNKRLIELEKEALVIIAEAVDAIGDACAIYGFSGYGRDHVAFYVAKDFGDAYDGRTRERIGRIGWKMENRDGTAIRHATRKLKQVPAKSKLLVLLSDGRPLDCGCDHYYDVYAQEDTRMALREARTDGVHPFCITVDPRGRRYLESMYGEVGYVVIDRPETLPEKLPRIYRRLTR